MCDHFSLSLSVGLSTQCSPCHGQLQSALWSIKPKCFQGGKAKPSAFSACKALVWNVFISHSCLCSSPEPHQDLCATGTRHHTMAAPGALLCEHLHVQRQVTAAYGLGMKSFFKQITTPLLQLSYWSSPAKLRSICIKRGSSATAQ